MQSIEVKCWKQSGISPCSSGGILTQVLNLTFHFHKRFLQVRHHNQSPLQSCCSLVSTLPWRGFQRSQRCLNACISEILPRLYLLCVGLCMWLSRTRNAFVIPGIRVSSAFTAAECVMAPAPLALQEVRCRFSSFQVGFWRIFSLAGTCRMLFSDFLWINWTFLGNGEGAFNWDGFCRELMFASLLKEAIGANTVQSSQFHELLEANQCKWYLCGIPEKPMQG